MIARQINSPYTSSYSLKNNNNSQNFMLYGVFDGHGGAACSQFIEKNIATFVQNNKLLITDPKKCIQ